MNEKIYNDDIIYFRKDGELFSIQRDGSVYHECEHCDSAQCSHFYIVAESIEEFNAEFDKSES